MADAFGTLLAVDNTKVRKWGRLLVALEDYSADIPATFFNPTERTPILPSGAKQLGFITTDGVTLGRNISSNDTPMLQELEPVRSDVESIVSTIACAFGEASNAYVHAVHEGKQVADFPDSPDGPWNFSGGEVADFPYYRVHLLGVDGVGDQARYRYIYGHRGKVTATTDRTLARSNPETLGFTITLYKDPVVGKTYEEMENGPAYITTP